MPATNKFVLSRRRLLKTTGAASVALTTPMVFGTTAQAQTLEKTSLKFGFIKLTDMAPIAIAKEKGFFAQFGITDVEIEAQANWKVLLDGVIDGVLDGAHMLAGQPIGANIGFGRQADLITPFSMDLNGNGITVSNEIWERMKPNIPHDADGKPIHPISASALKPIVEEELAKGNEFPMGMVFPVSTHNYELRYWLAAGGLHPGFYTSADPSGQTDADVKLSVTPPPQMPATLASGTIHGYCVGEPWNQQAVFQGIGVPVITDYQLWHDNPEKVFGFTREWTQKHPNTTNAVIKALILAGQWLDEEDENGVLVNREEAVGILAQPNYVGAPYEVIANSMTGFFEYEKGDKRPQSEFNIFFRKFATYPFYSDCIWYLTQMRRWGQIPTFRPKAFYDAIAQRVYQPDMYMAAATELVNEGLVPEAAIPFGSDGYRPATAEFIDGISYDGRDPEGYLASLEIGLKGESV